VVVYRGGDLVAEVDLYDYLLRGDKGGDITLKSGDTVFVTTIGQVATVRGAVKRPAIYELAGGESVADVIRLAGGFTAEAFPERIEITRLSNEAGLVSLVLDCSSPAGADSTMSESMATPEVPAPAGADPASLDCLTGEWVADGDEITVYSVWHVYPKEYVSIEGEVQFPDEYPLYPGMAVSDLVFRAGGLLDQAYTLTAEVSRIEEEPEASGLVTDLIFIDLRDVMENPHSEADVVLERADKVFVRKIPGWRSQHLVKLSGEVRFPGTYTMSTKEERLSYLIERAGGLTPEAFPEAGSLHRQEEGRVIVDFARALDEPGGRDDIQLEDGDSVHVPVYLGTIKVEGAVGRPGSIMFRPGKSANYYIDRTGGFLEAANKGSVRIVRLDGSSVTARKRFWFDPEVEPGNQITVELKDPRAGINWMATIKDAAAIVASMATTVYIITRIDD
jgi:protein involved in polysaccharide export with SLBB domain